MRRIIFAMLVLLFLVSVVSFGCKKDASGEKSFTGVLESINVDAKTITVDGKDYKVAEGMVQFAKIAKTGKTFKFFMDANGNIIKAEPQG